MEIRAASDLRQTGSHAPSNEVKQQRHSAPACTESGRMHCYDYSGADCARNAPSIGSGTSRNSGLRSAKEITGSTGESSAESDKNASNSLKPISKGRIKPERSTSESISATEKADLEVQQLDSHVALPKILESSEMARITAPQDSLKKDTEPLPGHQQKVLLHRKRKLGDSSLQDSRDTHRRTGSANTKPVDTTEDATDFHRDVSGNTTECQSFALSNATTNTEEHTSPQDESASSLKANCSKLKEMTELRNGCAKKARLREASRGLNAPKNSTSNASCEGRRYNTRFKGVIKNEVTKR